MNMSKYRLELTIDDEFTYGVTTETPLEPSIPKYDPAIFDMLSDFFYDLIAGEEWIREEGKKGFQPFVKLISIKDTKEKDL